MCVCVYVYKERERKKEERSERTRLQDIRKDNEIQNDLEDAPRRKKSSEQTGHKAVGGGATQEGGAGSREGEREEEQRGMGDGTGEGKRHRKIPSDVSQISPRGGSRVP